MLVALPAVAAGWTLLLSLLVRHALVLTRADQVVDKLPVKEIVGFRQELVEPKTFTHTL